MLAHYLVGVALYEVYKVFCKFIQNTLFLQNKISCFDNTRHFALRKQDIYDFKDCYIGSY